MKPHPNGSRFIAPLRCLIRTSTLPSASASCCLHCSTSFAPSSNSFTESSSDTSPRSIWATMPSSCFSDCSKFCNGGSFGLRVLRLQHARNHIGGQRVAGQRSTHLNALHHAARRGQHLLRNSYAFGPRQLRRRSLLHP